MSEYCTDIGWVSLNKHGEQLCGDHVEILNPDPDNTIVVLADGLGSGVKASILSTLTAKLLSTMIAGGLPVEECVSAMASTLPVCKERQIAYSTFSIVHITGNAEAELIQYDSPEILVLRDGRRLSYPRRTSEIDGKPVHFAQLRLQEGDALVLFSDGVEYAGPHQRARRAAQKAHAQQHRFADAPAVFSGPALVHAVEHRSQQAHCRQPEQIVFHPWLPQHGWAPRSQRLPQASMRVSPR